MHRLLRLAENIFVVFSLFLSTTALIPVLLSSDDASRIAVDPLSPILFMGIYAVIILIIFTQKRNFAYIAQKDVWIWLLMGITIASVLWTVSPDLTPRRSLLMLGTTIFGVYLAMRYTLREQLHLLAWALGIIVLLSLVFGIALPSYGLMTTQEGGIHAGAWRGIMSHKNILGRLMVFSSMVFLSVALANPITTRKYRWIPWAGYVLSILLVILSTSKTSLVVLLTLTIVMPLYRIWRRNYTQLVPIMIAIVLMVGITGVLFIDNLPVIAGLIGKDLTLTGRTEIWGVMLELISDRPFLGYGFNGFWRGWDTDVSAYVWRRLGWECPYGHNGFMDLLAELGMSGLTVFFLSLITGYIQGISWLRLTRMVEGLWPLMYLTFMVMYNISESTLLATNSIFWIVYVSTIFSMAMEHEQAKIIFSQRGMMTPERWIALQKSHEQN